MLLVHSVHIIFTSFIVFKYRIMPFFFFWSYIFLFLYSYKIYPLNFFISYLWYSYYASINSLHSFLISIFLVVVLIMLVDKKISFLYSKFGSLTMLRPIHFFYLINFSV